MNRGTCIHFRGTGSDPICAAGVDYRKVFAPNEAIACRAPCIQEYKTHERVNGKLTPVWKAWERHGEKEMPCALRVMPTEDEIAAADAEWAQHMEKMKKVMAVVKQWKTWTPRDRVAKQDVIQCPACNGRLHLSQVAYNGHIWGKCETEGCVSWME